MRKPLVPLTYSSFPRLLRGVALIAALGVLVTSTAACPSKPTMQVHNARITHVSPFGIGMDVVVKVHNDNSFDIMVRRVTAQTTIAGRYRMPQVSVQPNAWLPADKSTFVTAPVVIPWHLVPGVLSATMGSENVSYHVQGWADVSATRMLGVQVNNQPIDERGVVPREVVLRAARTSIPGAR